MVFPFDHKTLAFDTLLREPYQLDVIAVHIAIGVADQRQRSPDSHATNRRLCFDKLEHFSSGHREYDLGGVLFFVVGGLSNSLGAVFLIIFLKLFRII